MASVSGSDPWSLAAQRLYRAISNQHKYSNDEAIGILLHEVQTNEDSDLTESSEEFPHFSKIFFDTNSNSI